MPGQGHRSCRLRYRNEYAMIVLVTEEGTDRLSGIACSIWEAVVFGSSSKQAQFAVIPWFQQEIASRLHLSNRLVVESERVDRKR